MDLASVVAALASVGVRVSGSTPNNKIQGDSSRACPTGLAGPEPPGTHNDPGQHFHTHTAIAPPCHPRARALARLVSSSQGMAGLAWHGMVWLGVRARCFHNEVW